MGSLFVIIAGALWGSMGIFVRNLSKCGLSSMEICAVRVTMAALFMAAFLAIYNKKLFKLTIKDTWCFIGTGVFSLTFFGYCYFTTIQITSMSVAAVLLYTSPVFVLLISAVLFKEKITVRKLICIAIALTGCIFVTGILGEGMSIPVAGIMTGLGAGLGYALYSIFGRFALNKNYHPFTITFYSFLFSAVTLMFLTNPVKIVNKIANEEMAVNIMWVIGLTLVTTVLPYIFYTLGLSMVENSKAAVMACTEPIVATILGFIVFYEKLTAYELIGIILVLISIVLINKKDVKNESI